jgi:hypothetical protein
MDQIVEYERHFSIQQSVRVAIYGPDGTLRGQQPATVTSLTRDLLELELEEDCFNADTAISPGDLVELRSGIKGSGFRCRALLIGGTDSSYLLVRLVGDVIFEELREFFRIDAYLPIRCFPLPDWDFRSVQRSWLERIEQISREKTTPPSYIYQGEPGPAPPEPPPLGLEPPAAANISGGGLRTRTTEKLQNGECAILELLVPGPDSQIIIAAGEVVASDPEPTNLGDRGFNTAFKFTCIQNSDREAMINFIQRVQLQQLRQMAEELPALARIGESSGPLSDIRRPPSTLHRLAMVIIALLAILLIVSLVNYYRHPTKGEIDRIFTEGIKKYLEQHPTR